jgi:F0F1-type ATP synthase membrane subunit b/b'
MIILIFLALFLVVALYIIYERTDHASERRAKRLQKELDKAHAITFDLKWDNEKNRAK